MSILLDEKMLNYSVSRVSIKNTIVNQERLVFPLDRGTGGEYAIRGIGIKSIMTDSVAKEIRLEFGDIARANNVYSYGAVNTETSSALAGVVRDYSALTMPVNMMLNDNFTLLTFEDSSANNNYISIRVTDRDKAALNYSYMTINVCLYYRRWTPVKT